MQPSLFFTNSLSKKKELFIPLITKQVSLYVCGITPYDRAHLGHGRVYVNFDILFRLLKHLDFDVTYVRNYTDIDDKILKKSVLEFGTEEQFLAISNRYIDAYKDDMAKLNCLSPSIEPRVTTSIASIITFIEGLLKKGKAYQVDNDVYFSISTLPSYGTLSGKNIEELEAGSRVDVDPRKKHPGDFALWKGTESSVSWISPWGKGRPGWHIECSVMAKDNLGESIDIHAGGADLMFPHHENEIAQSEGLHDKIFARYWLHNAFVNINKEKMSKSLGNMVNLANIFEEHDPMILRYYYLQHHYRTPIDFSFSDLQAVIPAYKKLVLLFQDSTADFCLPEDPIIKQLLDALCDDLNTSRFMGLIFQQSIIINENPLLKKTIKYLLQNIIGLSLQPLPEKEVIITDEIKKLIEEREIARTNKDWQRADKIREQLTTMGINAHDKKAS